MTAPETVPLPEHLAHCGCPLAPTRHLTSCRPAREYDATPLPERPEYQQGFTRFAAVSWQFPVTFTAEVLVEVEIDPAAYIERHRHEYDDYEMEPGFEDWEKPLCFISERIREGCDDIWASMPFGDKRHESSVRTYVDEIRERPRWKPEDTAALDAPTPSVDPNQVALFGGAA